MIVFNLNSIVDRVARATSAYKMYVVDVVA